jgi:hypothetical protein
MNACTPQNNPQGLFLAVMSEIASFPSLYVHILLLRIFSNAVEIYSYLSSLIPKAQPSIPLIFVTPFAPISTFHNSFHLFLASKSFNCKVRHGQTSCTLSFCQIESPERPRPKWSSTTASMAILPQHPPHPTIPTSHLLFWCRLAPSSLTMRTTSSCLLRP